MAVECGRLTPRCTAVAEHNSEQLPGHGRVDLDCDILTVDGADLRVLVFTAAPGSPAADAIALLASNDVERMPTSAD